jgi:hypothetical protein
MAVTTKTNGGASRQKIGEEFHLKHEVNYIVRFAKKLQPDSLPDKLLRPPDLVTRQYLPLGAPEIVNHSQAEIMSSKIATAPYGWPE